MMDMRWRWRYERRWRGRRGTKRRRRFNTHQRLLRGSDDNWQTSGPEFGFYIKVIKERVILFPFFLASRWITPTGLFGGEAIRSRTFV